MSRVTFREACKNDIDKIVALEKKVWGTNAATKENITNRIKTFPKGNIVGELEGQIVGYVGTVIMNQEFADRCKTWYEYTDNGNAVSVFDPMGDILFGISLTVDTDTRNKGVGSSLLLNVARMSIENRLKAGILGGRLPYYHKKKDLSVDEYAALKNSSGKIYDPELRLYNRMGLKIVKLQEDYFNDPESLNYGVILRWNNPFYQLTRWFPFLARPLSYLFRL